MTALSVFLTHMSITALFLYIQVKNDWKIVTYLMMATITEIEVSFNGKIG
jgi:hypothetical protein